MTITAEEAQKILVDLRKVARELSTDALRLDGRREFVIDPDENDPHEGGPIRVEISSYGIRVRWDGETRPRWNVDWFGFRHMIETQLQWEKECERERRDHECLTRLVAELKCQRLPMRRPAECGWDPFCIHAPRETMPAHANASIDPDFVVPPPKPRLFPTWRKL